jgi:phosphoserine phosphatase
MSQPSSAPASSAPAAPVLCVDLDGTLLATDLLWLSVGRLVRERPVLALCLPIWLLRGRASLKREVTRRVRLDPAALPYRAEVLDFLRGERAAGRRLVLATAADASAAEAVAAHVGLFAEVLASDGKRNLSGKRKADALELRFGTRGFDYAGDAAVDVPLWSRANAAVVVSSSPRLLARVRRVAPVRASFAAEDGPAAGLRRALRALAAGSSRPPS